VSPVPLIAVSSQFLRGVLSVVGSKIGAMFLGVLTTPIIVRLLGSDLYGDYAAVMAIFGILIIFSDAGVMDGTRKYISEERSLEGWESQIFAFYFRWSLLLSIIVTSILISIAMSGYTSILFPDNHLQYIILIALLLFVTQFSTVLRGTLMGLRLEHYSETLQLIKQLVQSCTVILLVYFGFGVSGAIIGDIIGVLVIVIVSLSLVRREISLSIVFKEISKEISRREVLSYNILSTFLSLFMVSLYHTDVILLQGIVGGSQTGFYKAALNVAQFIWVVPTAVQLVLVQSVSPQWAAGKRSQVSNTAAKATRYTLAFGILPIIGLGVLADIFIPIYYGPEFVATVEPLLLLLPGVLGFAVARPIFAIGQGIGSLRKLVVATGCAALINISLNLILIPRYGMHGAAAGTSIGYGSMVIFHTIAAKEIGYSPLADLRFPRVIITSLITFVVLIIVRLIIPGEVLTLLLLPPLGGIVYLLTIVITGVISPEECLSLADELPVNSKKVEILLQRIPTL